MPKFRKKPVEIEAWLFDGCRSAMNKANPVSVEGT
jgi:hypothetical protein